jgi:hypothetical protein
MLICRQDSPSLQYQRATRLNAAYPTRSNSTARQHGRAELAGTREKAKRSTRGCSNKVGPDATHRGEIEQAKKFLAQH